MRGFELLRRLSFFALFVSFVSVDAKAKESLVGACRKSQTPLRKIETSGRAGYKLGKNLLRLVDPDTGFEDESETNEWVERVLRFSKAEQTSLQKRFLSHLEVYDFPDKEEVKEAAFYRLWQKLEWCSNGCDSELFDRLTAYVEKLYYQLSDRFSAKGALTDAFWNPKNSRIKAAALKILHFSDPPLGTEWVDLISNFPPDDKVEMIYQIANYAGTLPVFASVVQKDPSAKKELINPIFQAYAGTSDPAIRESISIMAHTIDPRFKDLIAFVSDPSNEAKRAAYQRSYRELVMAGVGPVVGVKTLNLGSLNLTRVELIRALDKQGIMPTDEQGSFQMEVVVKYFATYPEKGKKIIELILKSTPYQKDLVVNTLLSRIESSYRRSLDGTDEFNLTTIHPKVELEILKNLTARLSETYELKVYVQFWKAGEKLRRSEKALKNVGKKIALKRELKGFKNLLKKRRAASARGQRYE